MPDPTRKNLALDSLIEDVMGKHRVSTVKDEACMTCQDPDMNFKDEISRKEYRISGMCQRCQDSVFGEEVEEY